jgi:hypothetical protein
MSRNTIIVLMYHCHELTDLVYEVQTKKKFTISVEGQGLEPSEYNLNASTMTFLYACVAGVSGLFRLSFIKFI